MRDRCGDTSATRAGLRGGLATLFATQLGWIRQDAPGRRTGRDAHLGPETLTKCYAMAQGGTAETEFQVRCFRSTLPRGSALEGVLPDGSRARLAHHRHMTDGKLS